MKLKIFLAILVVATLAGLLIYSQRREGTRRVSGFVEADEIRVGSRVGGRVAEVFVQEGQSVAAGQILIRLEPFDLQERMKEAEAMLAARRADFRKMEAGLLPQEIAQKKARVDRLAAMANKLKTGPLPEEIAAAQSRLNLAQAQLDRAKKVHDRTMTLVNRDSGAVSRDEIDLVVESLKVAESSEQVRREELILLKKGTRAEDIAAIEAEQHEAMEAHSLAQAGFRQEDIAQSQAVVESAEAALNAIKTQLAELEIKAGVPGIVDAIQLRPGDLVAPNSPVLTLIDIRRLWIRAYVPENQLNLKLGETFDVTVDSFPNNKFGAELSFISTNAEFTPRNVQTVDERAKQVVRIRLYLKEGFDQLHPGMAADVWLDKRRD